MSEVPSREEFNKRVTLIEERIKQNILQAQELRGLATGMQWAKKVLTGEIEIAEEPKEEKK